MSRFYGSVCIWDPTPIPTLHPMRKTPKFTLYVARSRRKPPNRPLANATRTAYRAHNPACDQTYLHRRQNAAAAEWQRSKQVATRQIVRQWG